MIYQSAGCYTEAEAEYEIASKISPRSAHPLFNLASAQIQAADDPLHRDAAIERALKTLSRALEINPASSLAHCLSGSAHMKVSAYAEAEKSFQRALHFDSRMAAARLMLADLYMRQKQWNEAIGHLNTYLDDYPNASDRSVVKQLRLEAQSHLQ
jgi:tetratricopeptide (TPR) repeat protein